MSFGPPSPSWHRKKSILRKMLLNKYKGKFSSGGYGVVFSYGGVNLDRCLTNSEVKEGKYSLVAAPPTGYQTKYTHSTCTLKLLYLL